MGFWDWLIPKKSAVLSSDAVWLTQHAKLAGIRKEVQEDRQPNLVVAHFPATLAQIEDDFGNHGLEHTVYRQRLSPREARRLVDDKGEKQIALVPSELLIPDEFPESIPNEGTKRIPILVAERHCLRAHDDRVVAFAQSLGWPCHVTFHNSLDDSLMQRFAGEWVANMLRKLGMEEDRKIESSMITRRIKAAQAQVAKRVTDDKRAESADEWIKLNISQEQ